MSEQLLAVTLTCGCELYTDLFGEGNHALIKRCRWAAACWDEIQAARLRCDLSAMEATTQAISDHIRLGFESGEFLHTVTGKSQ